MAPGTASLVVHLTDREVCQLIRRAPKGVHILDALWTKYEKGVFRALTAFSMPPRDPAFVRAKRHATHWVLTVGERADRPDDWLTDARKKG